MSRRSRQSHNRAPLAAFGIVALLTDYTANSDNQHENQRGRAVVRDRARNTLGRAILIG